MTLKETINEAIAANMNKVVHSDEKSNPSDWLKEGDSLICVSCMHLESLEIPQALKVFRKGKFGIISGKDSYKVKRNKLIHEQSPLHVWCLKHLEGKKEESANADRINRAAADMLATNAAFCFLTGGSAMDWVRLNDKDALTHGLKTATKNDGSQEFFSYRDSFFMKLSDEIKELFRSHIKSFSVTLDKITVQRVPYVAVLTYFFWEGRIAILLNSVHRMKSEEGDSDGNAQMVIKVLMETLGLSLPALRSKCHHFAYDGVYASREERTTNNGLALTDHFSELLGLESGDVTGNHDMSHNLQLVYSDVFKHEKKGDKKIKKVLNEVFEIMSNYNSGEGGTVFHEFAMRMHRAVLTNKSRQETRFVRSDLRGLQSYMVNLPTLYNIQGEIMQSCNLTCDNTGAKQAQALMDKMSDGKRLATITGLAFLENEYAICSVQSQHSRTFPTTTMAAIMVLDKKLEQLSEAWVWSKEDMVLAGFGAPHDIIQDLLSGSYEPRVKPGSLRRSTIQHSIYRRDHLRQQENLIATGISDKDLEEVLNWTPQIAANDDFDGTGSFSVEGFDDEAKEDVEEHLKALAQQLHERLGARLKILPLTLSAFEAFGGDLSWVDADNFYDVGTTKLENVFSDLVGVSKDNFDFDSCYTAYLIFMRFSRNKIIAAGGMVDLEKLWRMFWVEAHEQDEYSNFVELFEHIQIKSYSEAIAETVGSIMNIQLGSGRNLHPVNMNKEMFLRFNLAPLHVLKSLLIPEVVKDKIENERKTYFNKTNQKSMLKYESLSASIGNFRKDAEERSHLPATLFEKHLL